MNFNRRHALAALGALAAAPVTHAAGDSWPTRSIRLVLPYAAGGPTDVVARSLGMRMSQALGQPIIVDNRVGASGNIACDVVARAAPDGYTALYHSSGFTISPALYKKLPYDPVRDFTPVSMTSVIPAVIMVSKELPVNSIEEFVAYLKAHPGQLSYGTGGVGNITHLAIALFLQRLGLEAIHVPYKGTAPAMNDLIGGRLAFMLDAMSTGLPYIQDGRVRAVALTSGKRSPLLPQVPTLNETVMPGFIAPTWQGILLPAKAPAEVVRRFSEAIAAAVHDPDTRAQFASQGVQLESSTPDEFAAYIKTETERWAKAVRAAGIEPE